MRINIIDRFWHRTLRRPYRLARTVNQGTGVPVVLLHGIGRSGGVWQNVVQQLGGTQCRLVAFDLLGFGASPKPHWSQYGIDDHAQAVIASVERLKSSGQMVFVGHSMGCLVAVRVARLRPDLVKHLILYEMPLYEGLPEKFIYRLRLDMYFWFYKRVMRFTPSFNPENARLAERLAKRVVGFEVTRASWMPFIKSLENTIMKQTAADDIKHLPMPMEVIYGSFDMLVIRGKPKQFFGQDHRNITVRTIRARHEISPKASRFLVERIRSALSEEVVEERNER
jgi:pimeloyl-ACP methyl ester carboxylesterase